VDSAIYEAVLAMMESTVPEYSEGGLIRERSGAILPKTAPSNVYPTRDGDMIVMGANQDSVFARLADAMGQPELARDARFVDHIARGEHQAELDALIGAWSGALDAEPLLARLTEHGVPAGRIYRAPEMLADPHFQARRAIVDVAHPLFKNLKMQDVFPRLSATPGSVRWPGPALGAHNDEVYGEVLGLDAAQRARLAADGII
jgi:formyl-CoA transferase